MITTTLSINIRFHRKSNNLLQREMADKLEIKQRRYAAWEEGRAEPSNDFQVKLADIFGITVDQLLNPREDETAGVQPGSAGEQQGSED